MCYNKPRFNPQKMHLRRCDSGAVCWGKKKSSDEDGNLYSSHSLQISRNKSKNNPLMGTETFLDVNYLDLIFCFLR